MEHCLKCKSVYLKKHSKCPYCGFQKPSHGSKINPTLLWIAGIIIAAYFFANCGGNASGPMYPYDNQGTEDRLTELEYQEGVEEVEKCENDPCCEDALMGVPPEYSRCNSNSVDYEDETENEYRVGDQITCKGGCTNHKAGCDIKGNISVDSGNKIYHVPGGEFYNSTVINPDFGERWFCTEQEATDAGWRRSAK